MLPLNAVRAVPEQALRHRNCGLRRIGGKLACELQRRGKDFLARGQERVVQPCEERGVAGNSGSGEEQRARARVPQ